MKLPSPKNHSSQIKKRYFLSNPHRFMRVMQRLIIPFFVLSGCLVLIGCLWGLKFSPPDYQQGETVRIMYVHVPAAWMALFIYTFIASCAAVSFIWRHPLCDILGQAAAPIGASFTLVSLMTGAIWGKPIWGAWWVWDARLTSVFVLFFLYIGYILIASSYTDWTRGAKAASLLSLIGVVNLPIIKWSVEWWNTLHQPASIMRFSTSTIHSSFLGPLFTMALAFLLLFIALLLQRAQALIFIRKLAVLKANLR